MEQNKKDSRALIGQKAIVLNNDDILILKRGDQDWMPRPNGLDMPGGGLESMEDPVEGIIREIKEETGLEVSDVRPFYVKHYNENGQYVIMIVYKALATSNDIKLSKEHSAYFWMTKDEALNSELPIDFKEFIKSL
jgi:8-oxo-dGTP diphosphatase